MRIEHDKRIKNKEGAILGVDSQKAMEWSELNHILRIRNARYRAGFWKGTFDYWYTFMVKGNHKYQKKRRAKLYDHLKEDIEEIKKDLGAKKAYYYSKMAPIWKRLKENQIKAAEETDPEKLSSLSKEYKMIRSNLTRTKKETLDHLWKESKVKCSAMFCHEARKRGSLTCNWPNTLKRTFQFCLPFALWWGIVPILGPVREGYKQLKNNTSPCKFKEIRAWLEEQELKGLKP